MSKGGVASIVKRVIKGTAAAVLSGAEAWWRFRKTSNRGATCTFHGRQARERGCRPFRRSNVAGNVKFILYTHQHCKRSSVRGVPESKIANCRICSSEKEISDNPITTDLVAASVKVSKDKWNAPPASTSVFLWASHRKLPFLCTKEECK